MRSRNQITLLILCVLTPLIFGLFIYLTGRDENIYIVKWIGKLNEFQMPKWVNYNLPDGLFALSFMSTNFIFWNSNSFQRKTWEGIFITLLLSSELLQKHNVLSGTYDSMDIVFYLAFILIYYILKFIFSRADNSVNNKDL